MSAEHEILTKNIASVRQTIAEACERVGRRPEEVHIVAVSKTVDIARIKVAWECGLSEFGENRVQEAAQKIPYLPKEIKWHLVGSLQTNKVKKALSLFSLIHSVDRPALVEALARATGTTDQRLPVLMQVNVTGESTKHGIPIAEARRLARFIIQVGLELEGLMTIAPLTDNPEETRPVFRTLRQLRDDLRQLGLPHAPLNILSMGMSGDYTVAVEEGATHVRIGTAIFGMRQMNPA
ncbi:MAG TPA: YggS family pyridoxal phosphate-dependent enzyme [Firmicutes bacterium]|nr:YggS family pyridoxal phosphate-dependent enzyme [Bacillota bacterium]